MSRILFLDHTSVLGGAELFLLELAKCYGAEGRVILFAEGSFQERLQRDGVPVQVLAASDSVTGVGRGGKGLAQILAVPGVMRMAARVAREARKFDVLFANSQKAMVIGALAAKLARKPLVWYLHDIITAEHFSSFNRRLSVFLGNHFATQIIANSNASKAAFISSGGRPDLVSVVYNGMDDRPFFSPNEDLRRQIRAEFGLGAEPVVALFSRIAPWKGQHVLLDALTTLPGVHAWIVGAPLFRDEIHYLERLKERVCELGIQDRVHFLGFREEIPSLLQAADVVVHTSTAPEPFGRVIVEGMFARKPVVATRAGGACEIIEDGVTGRLITPSDPGELARVIRELFDNPLQAQAMANAGCQSARERFSPEVMMQGIEQILCAAQQ